MKKKEFIKEIIIIFWVFVIGSMVGYAYETILVLCQKGHFESRQGLLYGPFIPVYGIGAVVYYLFLKNIPTENKAKIFFLTAILGGVTEYLCSYIQEKVFHTISWDYSYLMFNINGRTSLLHCTYWGIAGILFVLCLGPLLEKMWKMLDKKGVNVITIILLTFFVFDISISWMAAERQTERRNNIAPENDVDIFLDAHYPDEYINRVLANKKEV